MEYFIPQHFKGNLFGKKCQLWVVFGCFLGIWFTEVQIYW